MALESVLKCPICGSLRLKNFLLCQDHTTSQESFSLRACTVCNFVFTSPRPDPASLSNYYKSDSYISHTATRKGIINSIYLLARKYTLGWKVQIIQKYKPAGSLLDYGCGTGDFLNKSRVNGFDVTGVEPADDARIKAESLTGKPIYRHLTELGNKKFEIITLWHVLEHVSDLKEKLFQLKRLLDQNGIIFIAVPNHESYDAVYYKEYWAGYDVPRHLWHFSKANMKALLSHVDLTLIEIKPMKLDSFYVSLLSENYKHQGTNKLSQIFNGILRGFKSNRLAKKKMNYSSLIYIARL